MVDIQIFSKHVSLTFIRYIRIGGISYDNLGGGASFSPLSQLYCCAYTKIDFFPQQIELKFLHRPKTDFFISEDAKNLWMEVIL